MNKELWNNVLAFDFDDPISEYGFTTRLANEHFWTKQFTESAIAEYKKFMYLAATSDCMVSPSAIVDTVWHQHLIFTKSYNNFCNEIGKQIQHIPSTHNRTEYEKFKQAKERTTKLYNEVFGEQPKEIWEYADMYDSLELPKANFNIRTFILIGILSFTILLIPFYYLLKPVYIHIENPYFVIGFITISIVAFGALEIFNSNYLTKAIEQFNSCSFINTLHPFELVYLETQKLSNVIHGTINQQIDENLIVVNSDYTIEHTLTLKANTIEENLVLNTMQHLGKTNYPTLVKILLTKPIFTNVANCMNALKKYYIKSTSFGKLFYINFAVLSFLLVIGTVRLSTGLLSDKPVTQIIALLLILTVFIVGYFWRLTNLFCSTTIPNYYKNKILPNRDTANNFQWHFFLLGTAAITTSFIPLINQLERRNNSSSDAGSSSCCSSCGSSCSSCGGCGGGD